MQERNVIAFHLCFILIIWFLQSHYTQQKVQLLLVKSETKLAIALCLRMHPQVPGFLFKMRTHPHTEEHFAPKVDTKLNTYHYSLDWHFISK